MFTKFYDGLAWIGGYIGDLLLLALRLYYGLALFLGGMGKLGHIEGVSQFLQTLNFPQPLFQAYLLGTVEMVGGLLLLLGLYARLAAIPVAIAMFFALWTAHHDAFVNIFKDPDNFLRQEPFNYFLTALIVFCFGPGRISIDYLMQKYVLKHPE
jgi:putative oxidoreductase